MNQKIKDYLNAQNPLGGACLVRAEGCGIGIAYLLSHNEGHWKADDVIVLWRNGDITAADDCEIVGPTDFWSTCDDLVSKA